MNERYIRQTMIPEIGEAGQEKLKNAKVLIVGIGGLGSPISLYLTAAGVGQIGLIDDDIVSKSNLQRQILYTEAEIGQSKVECACRRLSALRPILTASPPTMQINLSPLTISLSTDATMLRPVI